MIALYISLGAAGFILLLACFCLYSNRALKITRINIKIEGAPRIKILHLSDLHGASFGKRNSRLVKAAAAFSPDVTAFTGDIIHKYRPRDISVACDLVSDLSAIAPFFYISGNHEMRFKRYRELKKSLAESGAVILDDTCKQAFGYTFAGLNGANNSNGTLEKITPRTSPKILLAHQPQYFGKYAAAGYNLILCGHAHGGQWRIPFTRVGLYAPGQGMFPKYCSGVHVKDGSTMIISRGLGNSEFPLRLFNRPQVIEITING